MIKINIYKSQINIKKYFTAGKSIGNFLSSGEIFFLENRLRFDKVGSLHFYGIRCIRMTYTIVLYKVCNVCNSVASVETLL